MSDNSDTVEDELKMTRFRDDPEWYDVVPIPLSDDEQGVVHIATTDAFNDAYMYFRAIIQKGEISKRAFKLCERCVELNPTNYTAWKYRRLLLKELKEDLSKEFDYISEMIEDNEKNYQVWHHRKALVEWTNDMSRELAFTAEMIHIDAKNYHAWQHRHWAVEHFNLFGQAELDFSAAHIACDVRNNSAWNYRYFILDGMDALKDEDNLIREINFVQNSIKKVASNESAWNFLSGILLERGLSSRKDVFDFCGETCKSERTPLCLSFMVDVLMERIENKIDIEDSRKELNGLLDELERSDPIRAKYWSYCRESAQKL